MCNLFSFSLSCSINQQRHFVDDDNDFFFFQDAVINLKTLQEISSQLGFEWTVLAYELGFNRTEIGRFQTKSTEKNVQARSMLESW